MFPFIVLGIGVSALGLRQILPITRNSVLGVSSLLGHILSRNRTLFERYQDLQGFEQVMSSTEALKILHLSPLASREKIVQAHRNLMLRNHPDNGGSNFVASKINQAKDILLGTSKKF